MRIRWTGPVLAVALLAGCTSDPGQPTTLPSLTPSPTASPTATSSTSDLEAATNVVRRYYALLNGATTEANADALAALMASGCKCLEVANATREAALAGRHFFGRVTLRSLIPNIDGPTGADVLVHYDSTTSGVADAQGHVIHSDRARTNAAVDIRLSRHANLWRISAILNVNSGTPR